MFNTTIFFKTAHCVILAVALLLAWGCSRRPEAAALDRAESLMEEHPDSALALLDTIDGSGLTGEVQARHALLLSQALDKNYIDVTDDSLINIAVDYYEKGDDLRRLMLSHFYHARVLCNKESYARSLLVHHKSLRCAQQLGDDFWCGRNADQIFMIYAKFYYGNDALHYAQIAYDYFSKSQRQPFINESLLELTRAYYNADKYNDAISTAFVTIDSIKKYNNTELLRAAKMILGKSYFYEAKFDSAIMVFKELLNEKFESEVIGELGIAYIENDQFELANSLVLDTISSDSYSLQSLKAMLSKGNGDYKSSLLMVEKLMVENDKSLNNAVNQGFSQVISDYYEIENKARSLEVQNIKMSRTLIFFIFLIVLFCFAISAYLIYKRQNKIISKNLNIARNLKEILTLKENEFIETQNKIQALFAEKYASIDKLCTIYYESKATKAMKRRISDEVENLICSFSSDNRIAELEETINKNYSSILYHFKQDLPSLKQDDYRLFLYIALGFSNIAIALFLGEDEMEPVYNRKARLKTKIKKLETDRKNMYLAILEHNFSSNSFTTQ